MADAHHILDAIVPIILLLALGVAAAVGSRAIGLSPIVGYILLGIGLSSAGLDLLSDSASVTTLAELGVVLLLFDIGLHFSLKHIRAQARDIFAFGPVQVLGGALALGLLALAFGLSPMAAFLVGITLALSSTAVVAGLISERHQQNCPVGLTATAILIFQDVAAIFLLIVAGALGGEAAIVPAMGLALVKAAFAFGVAVLLARLVVGPLFDLIARSRNEEVFTAMALLVALAAGWATGAIGLSLTLGAFLGGMIIAETPYRAVIQSEIKPFRGLLLGFFFISVGLSLDLATLAALLAGGDRRRRAAAGRQGPHQRRRQPGLPLVGAGLDAAGLPAGAGLGVRLRHPQPADGPRAGRRTGEFRTDRRGGADPGGDAEPRPSRP